ncbi:pectate lyase [Opitutus sp. ER46]|uniref:pectate lyase family protein n=1 Tax=Opitutus sp. ER46 TaxID=2161864 RepID=UPI000D2F4EB4|nr:pectate lyase [Opitutus sp. ER46]PTX97749.1 pectate lyase [Opitutus sp. ER46]
MSRLTSWLAPLPFLVAATLATAAPASAPAMPAFPGAEGFGAKTPGGRGGRVLFVTNLNDSGPGSLRAACEAAGPRIVVFRVSGTIALRKPITVREPFLTIAGQTAPGDGICLRDDTLMIATHDVVVRFLRSRLGSESGRESDCIDFVHGARNSIIDHCSATWSVDECLSLSGDVQDCTVQWCLIGESLNASTHHKGSHGFGSLSRANGAISWHHNLWIHNNARNPRLGDNYGKPPFPTFDVRNNVIYNYGGTGTGLTQGNLRVNYVGNYIRRGPDSKAKTPISIGDKSNLQFYIRDNVFEGDAARTADNRGFFQALELDGVRQVFLKDDPFPAAAVTTWPAVEALQRVLADVGATRPKRDAVDARLVAHVRERTGRIIDSQADVGGWPELISLPAPKDSDQDGMPDDWEVAHGLDPAAAADGNGDRDQDGYTNIEEYLNSLAASAVPSAGAA